MRVGSATDVAPILSSDALRPREELSSLRESGATSGTAATGGTETTFATVLADMVQDASNADHVASDKIQALARGASDDLHGTMIATKEADISIKLVGSIRNKLLDAFHEIWRTSV